MKKHIALALIGTSLTALPVLAQQSNAPNTNAQANRANQNRAMVLKQGEWRGSKLTGLTVYNNNDERVGDINELIIGQDGKIEAVVIGVGGFLGIGEHNVALPFDQVKFVEEPRRVAAADTRPATATAPAGTRPADTTGTTAATQPATAARTGAADTYRGYPDHAMVNMNKDQLKALPEVRK